MISSLWTRKFRLRECYTQDPPGSDGRVEIRIQACHPPEPMFFLRSDHLTSEGFRITNTSGIFFFLIPLCYTFLKYSCMSNVDHNKRCEMTGIIMSIQTRVADGGLQVLFIFTLHRDIYRWNEISPHPRRKEFLMSWPVWMLSII